MKTILTPDRVLILPFYVTDEMSGCLTLNSGLWPHKTCACLIEVHLHVKSIGGGGEMKVLA